MVAAGLRPKGNKVNKALVLATTIDPVRLCELLQKSLASGRTPKADEPAPAEGMAYATSTPPKPKAKVKANAKTKREGVWLLNY